VAKTLCDAGKTVDAHYYQTKATDSRSAKIRSTQFVARSISLIFT
jgi:hypothetical protein